MRTDLRNVADVFALWIVVRSDDAAVRVQLNEEAIFFGLQNALNAREIEELAEDIVLV